jgi:hypothetical protein
MPSGSQRSMVPTLTSCGMPRGTPSLESAARSIRYTATPSDVGPYGKGLSSAMRPMIGTGP